MRFTKLYEELKFDDVFPVASDEEVSARKEQYYEIKLKEIFDNVEKTKLPDGTWHIHGDLIVPECKLTTLKDLNVSKVDGMFDCAYNWLTSLEGCPKEVEILNCESNKLTSLKDCPKIINNSLYCTNNELTSLEGCPSEIKGTFICSNNPIVTLKGFPTKIDGDCYARFLAKKFTAAEIRSICTISGKLIL